MTTASGFSVTPRQLENLERLGSFFDAIDAVATEPAPHHEAISKTICSLRDFSVESLRVYLEELQKARAEHDEEGMREIEDAIAELFKPPGPIEYRDLNAEWLEKRTTERGREVESEHLSRYDRFIDRYRVLKVFSGLDTIQKVADASGLSKTTVHAIENGRVTPQFRTIQKLAEAFGIPVADLAGHSLKPTG